MTHQTLTPPAPAIQPLEPRLFLSAAKPKVSFSITNILSNGAVTAPATDVTLINPWGTARAPGGPILVVSNAFDTATAYDGNGAPQIILGTNPPSPTLSIPPSPNAPDAHTAPTAVVANTTGGFGSPLVNSTRLTTFIFATEDGTLAAWGPGAGTQAKTVVDNNAAGAIYTGLAIAANNGVNFLYAADFHNARIDVFDTNFNAAASPGNFFDRKLPKGYAPYNVQNLGGNLFVTYAKQNPAAATDAPGNGHGIIDVFHADGTLFARVATGKTLNSPYSLAIAPPSFGPLAGALLVANAGSSRISVFAAGTSKPAGQLTGPDKKPLTIPGLYSLYPSTGEANTDPGAIYFASGPNNHAAGLFGKITIT